MSVTRKLLARIKALFEPSRPAARAQDLEVTPEPVAPAAEPPVVAEQVPLIAEEAPAIAEVAPAIAEVAPAIVEEAPATVAEAPVTVAETPAAVEEASILVEDAPESVEPVVVVAPGALTLRLEKERGPRSMFEVMKSSATIGRGPESTIQLADLSVSRKHAKITYKQGAYWLSDLGSMGGTWIDGSKLAAPRRVATGQIIDIGLCRLSVLSAGADEESSAAEGPSPAASGSSR